MKDFLFLKTILADIWVEVSIATFFECCSSCRCCHSKQKWRKTCRHSNCIFCMTKVVVSFWVNKQTRPRLLELANYINCFPLEITRDIDFIQSILKRVPRWQVSWIRSYYWLRLGRIRVKGHFLMSIITSMNLINLRSWESSETSAPYINKKKHKREE